ncbi:MAG: DinB family protein [Flavobacterium sp.]|nr:DinB family protein [Pedobacter sp.]
MYPPQADEFAPYCSAYINTVSDNVMGELEYQATSFPQFLAELSDETANHSYAEGKWTIKQLVGHTIDTERILAYRLLRISRNDKTPLPGFDENAYVSFSDFNERSLKSLANEFAALRKANMFLYNSIKEDDLHKTGSTNGTTVSIRALLFIIAGHLNHHRNIITDRYL